MDEESDGSCSNSRVKKDLDMSDSDDGKPSSSVSKRTEKKGRIILDSDEDNDDDKKDDSGKDGENSEEESDEDEYVVEKIVSSKKEKGKILYLIKWKDWPSAANTWEPEEHLSCPELLEEFKKKAASKAEKKREKTDISKKFEKLEAKKRISREKDNERNSDARKEKRLKSQNKSSKHKSPVAIQMEEDDDDDDGSITGFDRGLEAEQIMGAIQLQGKIMFLVKWKGLKKVDLVQADEANEKCPSVVIQYYEKRLEWIPESKNDDYLGDF